MGPDLGKAVNSDFEWVNAWATNAPAALATPDIEGARADAPTGQAGVDAGEVLSHDIAELRAVQSRREPPYLVVVGPAPPAGDQLMRDIVDIEHARDALQAERLFLQTAPKRTHAFMLIPARTADTVPVFVGGVLALMMLTVFGAAAMVSKLAR